MAQKRLPSTLQGTSTPNQVEEGRVLPTDGVPGPHHVTGAVTPSLWAQVPSSAKQEGDCDLRSLITVPPTDECTRVRCGPSFPFHSHCWRDHLSALTPGTRAILAQSKCLKAGQKGTHVVGLGTFWNTVLPKSSDNLYSQQELLSI